MVLYGPKQLADSMRTVRKNTIVIAEDIPERRTAIVLRREVDRWQRRFDTLLYYLGRIV